MKIQEEIEGINTGVATGKLSIREGREMLLDLFKRWALEMVDQWGDPDFIEWFKKRLDSIGGE